MDEVFITLKDAAELEGISYNALKKRVRNAPQDYQTQTQPGETGGRERVLVSVASLSAKARKAWRARQRVDGGEIIIKKRTSEGAAPWYVTADLNEYIESHKRAYYEAVEAARVVQDFIEYTGPEKRTDLAAQLAVRLGVSTQSFYRYQTQVLEANAWALKLQREDGQNRDWFRVLALCRKPKAKDTFPSLTPEQKAIIENIWFDKHFSENDPRVTQLYEEFEKQAALRGWPTCPGLKMVRRYIAYLMELPAAESARHLSKKGKRAWENERQVKGKRNATTLEPMEYVVADGHTFDVWVEYTARNGKKKAIKPVMVLWMDQRTRRPLGCVLCEHSNTQVVKQSFIKMCYEAGTVPKHVHMDNGKDFANRETLGQDRNQRAMMDAELKGFYLAMGAEKWSRSLPFHPWDKVIERAFGTFCTRFSKKFASYTGTLTGSRTDAKIDKPIQRMLERGELLTLEEFYELLEQFLHGWYDNHVHEGLRKAGEKWTTPLSLWEHAEHYAKGVPPMEYAAMLLMKPTRAKVNSQGIRKFNTLYTAPELGLYIQKWVNIRWDPEDVTRLYVYAESGEKVCEAYSAELLEFGDRVSQEALAELHTRKNHNKKVVTDFLEDMRTPFELRGEQADTEPPAVVGTLDLMIGHAPQSKIVSLPMDKEYQSEAASRRKRKQGGAGDEFLTAKGDSALAKLKVING